MVGIPLSWGYLPSQFFLQFLNCQMTWSRSGFAPRVMVNQNHRLEDSRNEIVKAALENSSDYLLFWDADVLPPDNMLPLLVQHMESGRDIVGLLCFKRNPPYYPIIFDANPGSDYSYFIKANYEKGCVPCAATGTGCLMIFWLENPCTADSGQGE